MSYAAGGRYEADILVGQGVRAMRKTVLGAVAAVAMLAGMPAHAAEMRVAKLASGPVVLVAGALAYGDGERFTAMTAALPKTTMVVFNSPGGNLLAGLTIGETIRKRGYTTLVGDGSTCASSCAIAWLGGSKRYLASGGRLGFHAASNGDGVSAPGNAIVGAYMARLGLNQDAVYALTAASPYEIAWVDASRARSLGITVEPYAGAPFGGGGTALASRGGSRPAPAPSWDDDDAPRPGTGTTKVHGGYASGGTGTGTGGRAPRPAPAPACAPYVYGGHSGC